MGEPTVRNGTVSLPEYIGYGRHTRGTETAHYLKEEKENSIQLVEARETGKSLTKELALRVWRTGTLDCNG